MHRRKRVFSILFLALLVLGCSADSSKKSASENQNADEPVKVTFIELGSVNCVPCRMMQPIMDEIREEYPRDVEVLFYDVWTPAGKPYAEQFGIRVIPTQVFLDAAGNEFYRHEGFLSKEQLIPILEQEGAEG